MPADLEAAGIDALWLPELPTVVQLFLALSLKGTTEEFARGVIHNAEIYLVAPGPTAAVAVSFELSAVHGACAGGRSPCRGAIRRS